jgi:hypothetical protein
MGFKGKIQRCRKVIKQWVRKTKPLTEKCIQEKTAALAKLQEAADPLNVQVEKELKKEIHDMLEQEDLKWRQWAKEAWLRDGDHNTKYFHACATQRQQRN